METCHLSPASGRKHVVGIIRSRIVKGLILDPIIYTVSKSVVFSGRRSIEIVVDPFPQQSKPVMSAKPSQSTGSADCVVNRISKADPCGEMRVSKSHGMTALCCLHMGASTKARRKQLFRCVLWAQPSNLILLFAGVLLHWLTKAGIYFSQPLLKSLKCQAF